MRPSTSLPIGVALVVAVLTASGPVARAESLDTVRARLTADGFDPELVERSFRQARYLHDRVERNIFQRESKASYAPFTSDDRVTRARRYLAQYRDPLTSVEERYGVDAEVIVSILLIESDLGRVHGKHPVVAVLASLVAANSDAALERMAREHADELPKGTVEGLHRRVARKADWAYGQLKAILELSRQGALADPAELVGSWAGAFGITQFIPTSALEYGADGNGDGRIDLYEEMDAFASIANYLRRHGWKPDASPEARRKAVLAYNRSGYYADAVLDVARLLADAS